jgi:hypothetical protein
VALFEERGDGVNDRKVAAAALAAVLWANLMH